MLYSYTLKGQFPECVRVAAWGGCGLHMHITEARKPDLVYSTNHDPLYTPLMQVQVVSILRLNE
jgi:hypothetical protein